MPVRNPSFVTLDGRRMACDEVSPPHPKGTVLLLTGLASNRLAWYKQLEAFGRTFRTFALDFRESGDSDPVSKPYTLGDLADDAASILKGLGIPRAHVVGISMGGAVALHVALRHPESVEKLVVIAATAGGKAYVPPGPNLLTLMGQLDPRLEIGERTRQTYAALAAPGYFDHHPEDGERIAADAQYRPQSQAAYWRQLQAVIAHDVAGQLDRIEAPTLIVQGELDPLVVPSNARYLAQHIKGAKLLLYPNTGHPVIIERAEELNRDVLAFLEREREA
jgi:3-oxoadipate enol-lactonase